MPPKKKQKAPAKKAAKQPKYGYNAREAEARPRRPAASPLNPVVDVGGIRFDNARVDVTGVRDKRPKSSPSRQPRYNGIEYQAGWNPKKK